MSSPPVQRLYSALSQYFSLHREQFPETYESWKRELELLQSESESEPEQLGDSADDGDIEENFLMNAVEHYNSLLSSQRSLSANRSAGREVRDEKQREELFRSVALEPVKQYQTLNRRALFSDDTRIQHTLTQENSNILAVCPIYLSDSDSDSVSASLHYGAFACADKSVSMFAYRPDSPNSFARICQVTELAPVLTLVPHPVYPGLFAGGLMNGSVVLYYCSPESPDSFTSIARFSDPADPKYILNLCWSPDGEHLVSSSFSGSLRLFSYHSHVDRQLNCIKSLKFARAVEALTWLNPHQFYLCQHEDNLLRLIHIRDLNAIGNPAEVTFNLNALQDDHVSFTALHLSLSPCQRMLAVLTNTHRIIVLQVGSSLQLRNYYHVPADLYSNPKCLWSPNSQFLFAVGQDRAVYTMNIVTGQSAAPVSLGHTDKIKQFTWADRQFTTILSCSFDKTLRVTHRTQALNGDSENQ